MTDLTDTLTAYQQKRNFERTPEPEGKIAQERGRLKFVVQHHIARRDHYDFRLEWGGVLLSWAVPKGPSDDPRDKRLTVRVEDHPLEYADFEGTIPKGEYGGGVVMIWDEGSWEPLDDVTRGIREGALKFALRGSRLKGKWALIRLKARAGETKENWLLFKERDEYAKGADELSGLVTSVRTGRSMAEIEAGGDARRTQNPFHQADVQLAQLVHEIPAGADWLYELKYDGYRILAYLEGNGVRLVSRNGNDYTGRFHAVADSLSKWADGRAMVLDGEMVVVGADGRTDFQALQRSLRNPEGNAPTYIVFDLLALEGADFRTRPLVERKELLESLLRNAPQNLFFSRHIRGNGQENLLAACRSGLEGIVGKKAGSPYGGTRNGDWIKLKCCKRQEFVVVGYSSSDKRANGISSLLLGYYADAALIYAGRAGSGLDEAERQALGAELAQIGRAGAPVQNAPVPGSNESIHWVEPELVAEIQFAEWTDEHLLRQAVFKGLRADKDPKTVTRERSDTKGEEPVQATHNAVVIEGVRVTNPRKQLFSDPAITKEAVARYYAQISKRMLPYVRNRVLSIVRCPKGISESCFYKKHPDPNVKGIVVVPISTGAGEAEDYFYIEDASGLVSEAQMGTLEFHVWGSRVQELETPDMLVFDLDPDVGMALDRVRQGARDVKSVLDELSLRSYLKTSGGKGYHVVVPLKPAAAWEPCHDFARRVAAVMEQKWPDRYTGNVRKDSRQDRIFVDWIRNGRGATSIAPYSIRARNGAPVSMPIKWEELDSIAPNGVTMEDALARSEGADPWAGFFEENQRIR